VPILQGLTGLNLGCAYFSENNIKLYPGGAGKGGALVEIIRYLFCDNFALVIDLEMR